MSSASATAPPEPNSRSPRLRWVIGALLALAFLAVFIVPWFVPVSVTQIWSDSQVVGFNNTVSVLGLGLVALVIAIVSARQRARSQLFVTEYRVAKRRGLGPVMIGVAAVYAGAVELVLGRLYRGFPPGDVAYLADRLLYMVNGATPYRDFQFPYGPILLLPQYWLWRIARGVIDPFAATYIALAASAAIGVLILAYVVERLRSSASQKRLLFVGFVLFASLQPTLASNYSMVRTLLPFALLLAVLAFARPGRSTSTIVMVAAAACVVDFLVSPEAGVALAVGMIVAFAWRAWTGDRASRIVAILLALLVAVESFAAFQFSYVPAALGGAAHEPVLLAAFSICFVVSVLCVAWAGGAAGRSPRVAANAPAVGWLAIVLVFLVTAMGRADWQHMVWNGIGAFVAAPAAIRATWARRRAARSWAMLTATVVILLATVFVWNLTLNNAYVVYNAAARSGAIGPGTTVRISQAVWGRTGQGDTVWNRARSADATAGALSALSSVKRVVSLDALQGPVGLALASSGALISDKGNALQVQTAGDLTAIYAELDRADYVLASASDYATHLKMIERGRYSMRLPKVIGGADWYGPLMTVPLAMPIRHPQLDAAASLWPLVNREFVLDRYVGCYALLRRRAVTQ